MPVSGRGAQAGADRPDAARVLNYWLGGNDNFAADREAGEVLLEVCSQLREMARENRRFILGATRWAAAALGIRQFADLGCGLPVYPPLHQEARSADGTAGVVYVDKDPLVIGHVRALEAIGPGLAAVLADVADPESVLGDKELRGIIDMAEPAALVLGGTLSDMSADAARATVAGFMKELAPGSVAVISCASFADQKIAERIASVFGPECGWRNHSPEDIASFFAAGNLRLVHGRIMDIRCWPACPVAAPGPAAVLGGIGMLD